MDLSRGASAVGVDQPDRGSDRGRIGRWPLQPYPKAGCRALVAEELRFAAVLRDQEVNASVAVVVGKRRPSLLSVDHDAGDVTGDRDEFPAAYSPEPQPPARVVPRRRDLGGEEVLAEKDVFVPVTVEVGHADVERWSELRFGRQGDGLERIAPIQKDRVIECVDGSPVDPREVATHHLVERGVRVFVEPGDVTANERHGQSQARVSQEGSDTPDPFVELRLQHVERAVIVEIREIHVQLVRIGPMRDVTTPTRGDDVEPAVAVYVTGGYPVPATPMRGESPRFVGRGEATALIEQEQQRPPLQSENEVGITVGIEVGEDGRRHEPNGFEGGAVRVVQHELATVV